MHIKFYGTRGSIPISNRESLKYGGNTTCVRIEDDSIPKNTAVVIDSGSGFIPFSRDILKDKNITDVLILYSHWHMDHTIGLPLSPLTFIKNFNITLLGPLEDDKGGKEMMEWILTSPYFPKDVREVKSHFVYKAVRTPNARVLIIHPEGFTVIDLDLYDLLVKYDEYVSIGKGKFPLRDFLVIKMLQTNHPQKTLSYAFTNMKTHKKFVFMTDHENGDGLPKIMKDHIDGANLLVMDCQYTRETYDKSCSGFGHSTPDYCVKIAEQCKVEKLGLIHHNPDSTDLDINQMVLEAYKSTKLAMTIFACADYDDIELI